MSAHFTRDNFNVAIQSESDGVTGSCMQITACFPDRSKTSFLIDCGLFQEPEYAARNRSFSFNPENISFVIVSHNHIDHTGRLGLLQKKGFFGKVYTSTDTSILMPLALQDTCHILKEAAKKENTSPIYNDTNVFNVMNMVVPCKFEETINVSQNIKMTMFKNGHLPGAEMILLQISYHEYEDINILFLGDIALKNMFFSVPNLPDWVLALPLTIVTESTYGDTNSSDIEFNFKRNVKKFFTEVPNGTLINPAFSLGRSQEVLYTFKQMQNEGLLSKDIPIFLDGKLSQSYTNLYLKRALSSIDKENLDFLPENFFYASKLDRINLCNSPEAKIIVASSGMGSYGPARTYLQKYISRSDSYIHFTGYAAEGTLARDIYDAAHDSTVNFGGLCIPKKARISYTSQFSAHAKADEILKFLGQFTNLLLVLVTHGEPEVKNKFAARIVEEIAPKNVGILSTTVFFRIGSRGLISAKPTSPLQVK